MLDFAIRHGREGPYQVCPCVRLKHQSVIRMYSIVDEAMRGKKEEGGVTKTRV